MLTELFDFRVFRAPRDTAHPELVDLLPRWVVADDEPAPYERGELIEYLALTRAVYARPRKP